MFALSPVTAVLLLVGCPADEQPEFATATDHQKAEMLRYCRGAGPWPELQPPAPPSVEQPSPAAPAEALQRITVSDGRRLVGNVVSLADGWYSIRLETGKVIILEQSEVVAIAPLNSPELAPVETPKPRKKAPRARLEPAEDDDDRPTAPSAARSAGIAAGIFFGIGYVPLTTIALAIDLLSGFRLFTAEARLVYLPIVGAFYLGTQQPSTGYAILLYAAGVSQVAGLVFLVTALALHAGETPSEPAAWYIAPGAGSSLAGVSIGFRGW